MIVRVWNGYASATHADAYPKQEPLAGFRGLYLLRRAERDEVHYQVLTLWDSMQAIRAFAGRQPSHAVVEPEAQAALVWFDAPVAHFDVLAGPDM